MKQELTCIICPRSCKLTVTVAENIVTITGNACPKGAVYGESELLHPVRTLTATVRVANRKDTMASVKTTAPIDKKHMADIMLALRKISVNAPITIGDCVPVDGYEVVITKTVL